MVGDRRIKELDGFRGVAVLSIVLLHYVVHHLQTTPGTTLAYGQKYFMFLWIGVDAFFVLSGFLIGGILMDQRQAPNYFKVFYLRRSLRIFPPYFLLLGCWAVAYWLAHGLPGMRWLLEPQFLGWPYLLYLQNFWMAAVGSTGPNFVAATWSLAVEEQFYLLFPLVVRFVSISALPLLLGVGILLAPTFRLGMAFLGPEWQQAQILLLPTRWDSLLFGALVAWGVRQHVVLTWLGRYRMLPLALLGLLCAFMITLPFFMNLAEPNLSPWRAFFVPLGIAVFFGLVLLMLHLGTLRPLAAVLSSDVLRFFGRISYSVYLFHTAILGLVFALLFGKEPILNGWRDWGGMLGAFALTVVLAQLSWRWIEGPLVKFGHQFRYVRAETPGRGSD